MNQNAEGRDDYPKVSHLVISASNEQKPVLAQAHPSAPNFFQKIIDRIYSHSMQARGYHTEHIGTIRVWRKNEQLPYSQRHKRYPDD